MFWVSAALSVGEQVVEVLLSVSADAVSDDDDDDDDDIYLKDSPTGTKSWSRGSP